METWMQTLEQVIGNISACMLKWKDKQYLHFRIFSIIFLVHVQDFIKKVCHRELWQDMMQFFFLKKKH